MQSEQSVGEIEDVAVPGHEVQAAQRGPGRAPWSGLRLLATSSGAALVFDGAVFAAMGVLGWKLVMPWNEAMTAGEGLMGMGLLVCAGLWASISAEDLYRWRKLCRRWSAAAAAHQPEAGEACVACDETAVASADAEPLAEDRWPRARSIVRPVRGPSGPLLRSPRSPWRVAAGSRG